MTILQTLEKRKLTADNNLNDFRTYPESLPVYEKICKHIFVWSYLRALTQAPLTMNPNKIRAHFNLVRNFLLEVANEEEKGRIMISADAFINSLDESKIIAVDSYSNELAVWISHNTPESLKKEAIALTK